MDNEFSDFDEDFTDFEIEANHVPDKHIMEKFNEHEGLEIEIPDDINESLSSLPSFEEVSLPKIPAVEITYVDEADIPVVVYHKDAKAKAKKSYICPECSKIYKREIFFAKHVSLCQPLPQQNENPGSASKGDGLNQKNTTPITATSTKQRKISYDQILTTDEEFRSMSEDILMNTISKAIKDRNHTRVRKNITFGNKIKAAAENMKKVFEEDKTILKKESTSIVSKIVDTIRVHNLTKASSREQMWRDILESLHNATFFSSWRDIATQKKFSEDEVDGLSGLFYYVTMNVCTAVMNNENLKHIETTEITEEPISEDEQNSIYYVAGFIIFSLTKKYQKLVKAHSDNISAIAALNFLNSIKIKSTENITGSNFLAFARKWSMAMDRGGLVKVNDNMFLFVRSIERHARNVLSINLLKSYRNEDLRDVLQRKLVQDNVLNHHWEKLTRFIPSSALANLLKEQVIVKWIDIRAYAFVKSYIQIIRRKLAGVLSDKSGPSQAAEKSLRKGLN